MKLVDIAEEIVQTLGLFLMELCIDDITISSIIYAIKNNHRIIAYEIPLGIDEISKLNLSTDKN